MLKTNTKRAAENIRLYIVDNFTPENYTDNPPQEFEQIAAFILDCFRSEFLPNENARRYYHYNEQAAFADWCAGLPSVLDTCYFYNRSAVDDLGELLEETEAEKARYTEEQAEKTLTYLIYRELTKAARRATK